MDYRKLVFYSSDQSQQLTCQQDANRPRSTTFAMTSLLLIEIVSTVLCF